MEIRSMFLFSTLAVLIISVGLIGQTQAGVADNIQAYWTFDDFDTTTAWPTDPAIPHEGDFQEGTKGIFEDTTGGGNDLYAGNSHSGAVVPYKATEGQFGGAFYADNDGHNNRGAIAIALNSDDVNFGNEPFTVTIWQKSINYKTNNWDNRHRGVIIGKYDYLDDVGGYNPNPESKDPPQVPQTDLGWRLGYSANIYGVFHRTNFNHRYVNMVMSNDTNLGDGDPWHDGKYGHFALTYEPNQGTPEEGWLRIYADGLEVASVQMDGTVLSTDTPLAIGWALEQGGNSTSGNFSAQSGLAGLSNQDQPAWVDDGAMIGQTLTAEQILTISALGAQPDIAHTLGDLPDVLDMVLAGSGSAVAGDLQWTYSTGLGGAKGDIVGSGTEFTLVLDDSGNGIVSQENLNSDLNGDDKVDELDMQILLSDYIPSGGSTYDADDLAALLNQFGLDNTTGGSSVPEPSSLILFLFAAMGLCAIRRRI